MHIYVYLHALYVYTYICTYLHVLYVYTYICTYANIHIHEHTYKHKVLLAVYHSCNWVISSYHKSYQQYEILLNYKKLEISCYQKKKK